MVAHGWREINNFVLYCCDLDYSHSVINPELMWSEDTASRSSSVCEKL